MCDNRQKIEKKKKTSDASLLKSILLITVILKLREKDFELKPQLNKDLHGSP